jgi:hypothetical protein
MRVTKPALAAMITASALASTLVTANGFTVDDRQPVEHVIPAWNYAEDHPLFDCRYDGNRVCGPDALVPVPVTAADLPTVVVLPGERLEHVQGGALHYQSWQSAPAATYRLESD